MIKETTGMDLSDIDRSEKVYAQSCLLEKYVELMPNCKAIDVLNAADDVITHMEYVIQTLKKSTYENSIVVKGGIHIGETMEVFPSGLEYTAENMKRSKATPELILRVFRDEIFKVMLISRNMFAVHSKHLGKDNTTVYITTRETLVGDEESIDKATLDAIDSVKEKTRFASMSSDEILTQTLENPELVTELIVDDIPDAEHSVVSINGVSFYVLTRDQMYASGIPVNMFKELEHPESPDKVGYLYRRIQAGKFITAFGYKFNDFTDDGLDDVIMSDFNNLKRVAMGDTPMMYDGKIVWVEDIQESCLSAIADKWNEMNRSVDA